MSTRTANWNIIRSFICETQNVVYMVNCKKQRCRNSDTYIYIGETEHSIKNRIGQHMGYIRNKVLNQATGHHFNSPGHSVSDMEFTVLEQ